MHVRVQEMKVESKNLGWKYCPRIESAEVMEYLGAMQNVDPDYIDKDVCYSVDPNAIAIYYDPFTDEIKTAYMVDFLKTMVIQHCLFKVRKSWDVKVY